MVKYTKSNLKKTQSVLEELGYVVRFEKGNFKSGYCIVENRKIVIINKFFDTDGRMSSLLDILSKIGVKESELSEEGLKFFHKLEIAPMEETEETLAEDEVQQPEEEKEVSEEEPTEKNDVDE